MRIGITGHQGFVGSSIRAAGIARGWEIVPISRAALASPNLDEVLASDRLQAVVHCAGSASVRNSLQSPDTDWEMSVGTWRPLLEACRRADTKPVLIFPSSAAVYGDPESLPTAESARVAPVSPYGFHKRICELLAEEYASSFGLRVSVVRIFSVFGAHQRKLFIWDMFQKALGSAPEIQVEGTGDESRDYLHIDDVASAMLALCRAPAPPPIGRVGGAFEILNLASGREYRLAELAARIGARVAPEKSVRFTNHARPGDPKRWCADVSRLRVRLPDWTPSDFDSNLEQCIRTWLGEHSASAQG